MDAPIYPPAAEFIPPAQVPVPFNLSTASLADVLSAPAAWAIVLKHAPLMAQVMAARQMKAMISNMSVEDLVDFGVLTPAAVEAINRDLAKLPRADWPADWPKP